MSQEDVKWESKPEVKLEGNDQKYGYDIADKVLVLKQFTGNDLKNLKDKLIKLKDKHSALKKILQGRVCVVVFVVDDIFAVLFAVAFVFAAVVP